MIGRLKGIIDIIESDYCILDVNGVGYIVYVSGKTIQNLPQKGESASLFIETHVREDHIHLYGFMDKEEQEWFNVLTTVKGVGTRMSLAILTILSPIELVNAFATQDKEAFLRVSGVGPKLAIRLITELKDKVVNKSIDIDNVVNIESANNNLNKNINDAVSALTNLGYNKSQSSDVISKIQKENPEISIEDMIRMGLRELSA